MNAFSPPDAANRRSDPDVVGRAMRELAGTDLDAAAAAHPRAADRRLRLARPQRARAAIDRSFAAAYAGARGARLVRIDGSGHMVMLDQPARFREEVGDFLRR